MLRNLLGSIRGRTGTTIKPVRRARDNHAGNAFGDIQEANMTDSAAAYTQGSAISRKLDVIQKKGGMRSRDVAQLLGTRPETVSRWNQGKAFPRPDTEKLLLELEYIVDLLSDFYSPQEARMWLFGRQRLLDGRTPADLIEEGRAQEVIAVIDQLREGVYV